MHQSVASCVQPVRHGSSIIFVSENNVLLFWHSRQSALHRLTQMYDGWSSFLTTSCWAQWVTWACCDSRSAFTMSASPHVSVHTNPFDRFCLPTLAQSQLLGSLLAGVSDSWLATGCCTTVPLAQERVCLCGVGYQYWPNHCTAQNQDGPM